MENRHSCHYVLKNNIEYVKIYVISKIDGEEVQGVPQ